MQPPVPATTQRRLTGHLSLGDTHFHLPEVHRYFPLSGMNWKRGITELSQEANVQVIHLTGLREQVIVLLVVSRSSM
jgi:hypothetical protein